MYVCAIEYFIFIEYVVKWIIFIYTLLTGKFIIYMNIYMKISYSIKCYNHSQTDFNKLYQFNTLFTTNKIVIKLKAIALKFN